ncbi:unnamed protein product, partial [Rotaria sp. Silwood1]
ENKITLSKILIVAMGFSIMIGLAGLSMGIYSIVRLSKDNSTQGTSSLGYRWYTAGTTVAGTGSSTSPLSSRLYGPRKICFGATSLLYIADVYDNRIQAWKVGDSTGTTVTGGSNAVAGNTSTDLNNPFSVYVDSNNNTYVADTYNHRIQFWSSGALNGTTLIGTGVNGSALNQLNYPRDLTYDSSSNILYISDTDNHRILSYTSGASNGIVVAGGNGPGTTYNQLFSPDGIYFDSSSNSLYITNFGAHTIVRWIVGSSGWTLVAGSIGSAGSTSTLLNSPSDVLLDSNGNVYVADTGNHRIQFFLSGQRNATTIAGVTGTVGNLYTLLNSPRSLDLDKQLNLYVSDTGNNRIQMFTRY